MSNWQSTLKRLLQALFGPLLKLLKRMQGNKNLHGQLAKACEKLQQQLENNDEPQKVWPLYTKVLSLARKCDSLEKLHHRAELTQVILHFDPLIKAQTPSAGLAVGQALSALIETNPQTAQTLDAAWRLSGRLNSVSASKHKVQQQICLQAAQMGDVNLLLSKLLNRRSERTLTAADLLQILDVFLENHTFQLTDPWRAFFEQFQPHELPQIHQVFAVVNRYVEAADLAEAAKDYRSAIGYLSPLADQESAFRTLTLANRLGDEDAIDQAHQKVAESLWQAGKNTDALEHFQKAGDLKRASDCYQRLGQLAPAIQCRPSINAEWMQAIRQASETTVRQHLDHQEFVAAIQLLKSTAQAWQEKSQLAEAERLQLLVSGVVKTARSAFTDESQGCEEPAKLDVFKRWSRLEEAAGNYLEAGLQAEKAQDHFAAAVLFEKASAFGQALVALESSSSEAVDPRKKAQLLEEGGDFFVAASLYEQLGDIDQAIALYAQAGEFLKAAALCQQQLGDEPALFDQRFQDLLTKAGQIEQLAERCAASAAAPGQSDPQKSRLWRRIKDLAEQGLLAQKWIDRAALELPDIEGMDRRRFEAQATAWVQAAQQQILAEYTDAMGLDLGTSNSVVCLYNKQHNQVEVVERQRQRQIPSVFAIDQSGQELVGIPIPELLSKSPRAIITHAKREMGSQRKFRAGGQDFRAEEVSARIINCARQFSREYLKRKIAAKVSTLAAQSIGLTPPADWVNDFLEQQPPIIPLSNIVITVPAYFNEAQKQATKTAGVLADISVLRLIHEPTAACLAQFSRENKAKKVLVADLGAGTFDLSLIHLDDRIFEVEEIEGDNALGSADLDEMIYSHFSQLIKAETGQEIPRNGQSATRLRQACEMLKIELSSQSEWTINLPYLMGDYTAPLALTRAELEHIAAAWIERIRQTCQKIQGKPDRVLLIGGGGLMPAVSRCIQDVFNLKSNSAYDPLTVVARGAGLQAAMLMGDVRETLLLDVVPFSLGIKCQAAPGQGEFSAVISKHTTIPTAKTQRYTTVEDSQTQIRIEIFQGESLIPDENFKIGEFTLKGLPLAKAGVPQIDVKFDIDANCLLTVTAQDASTGNQQSIAIADSHLLTPAQTTSLQTRFRSSQRYQESRLHLEKLTSEMNATLQAVESADVTTLSMRFHDRLQAYERNRERYSPTSADNSKLFEIYRDRVQQQDKTRLALDQSNILNQSVRFWLNQYISLDWRAKDIEHQVEQLIKEGGSVLQRAQNATIDIVDLAANYQKWIIVLDNLSINLEGNPEDLARHFLQLQRYSEALTQFEQLIEQLTEPLPLHQVELGLEVLARARKRQLYTTLFLEHAASLGVHRPDFESLNQAVQVYAASVVWLQVKLGTQTASGSGFVIGTHYIATNRHVLMDEATGKCVKPEAVQVITQAGTLRVVSIHLPTWGEDDVAILQVQPENTSLIPFRLGFSELVEVGERIMTVGFPSPELGEFTENLYCNTGLINRVRPSELCSERVLEVSIPLQGGISGAPILNQWGEVIGLLTFWTERRQALASGQIRSEQSFYAIPVGLLRRLQSEIQG
jgi:molecular chaperone DnaK